jgi:hypothetical protein
LLRGARLKVAAACIEDINYKAARGLDKRQIAALAGGEWIQRHQNLLITGATGADKTWLACALAQQACGQGISVMCWRETRMTRLLWLGLIPGLVAVAATGLSAYGSKRWAGRVRTLGGKLERGRIVREDRDMGVLERKLPALGIVTGGCQRRIPDELVMERCAARVGR